VVPNWSRFRVITVVVLASALSAACGNGDSSTPDQPPDEAAATTTVAPPGTTCSPRVDVVVFVNPAASQAAVDAVGTALTALPGVLGVSYADQQTAYEEFQRLFADNPEMLATVDPEVLPPSFRLTLDDPTRVQDVMTAAQSLDGVGQVVPADPPADNSSVC
jgi:FtsX extracellular domain